MEVSIFCLSPVESLGEIVSIKLQRSDMAVLIASLIWGVNYSSVKIILTSIPPFVAGVIRFFIAAIFILFLLKHMEGNIGVSWSHLRRMITSGIIGFGLQQICFLYGTLFLNASLVALFTAFTTGIMTIIAAFITHERLTRVMIGGVAISCVGMIFVVLGKNGSVAFTTSSWIGLLLIVSAGILGGFTPLLNKEPLAQYSSLRVTTWTIVVGSFFFLPLGVANVQAVAWTQLSWIVLFSVLFSALGATAIANIMWNYGIAHVGVVRMTIYGYLPPILGILLAIPLLHEYMSPVQWLGAAFTLGGVMLSQHH